MSPKPKPDESEVGALLDQLASGSTVQSNCMFQLALMLARIAVEPCAESYKDETAQSILGLIRAKPKSNVVRLFDRPAPAGEVGPEASPSRRPDPSTRRSGNR